ncbi:hypothetical protein [Pseudomonas izuensis]|uniref:hypothetical protein n=1 Tax=Pseudomonas izuensis TaxID=2684212 RepID=UPI00135BF786|nr:hypothetical protein [Pseudomonas izuensis]
MGESSDDIGKAYSSPNLTFEELVERKALNHQRMDAIREKWHAENAAMTISERLEAAERFGRAFETIAEQFSRSRRLVAYKRSVSEKSD